MKDFDKLSEEKQIAHIDQKIKLAPYTKAFKSWFIDKWESDSKLLVFHRAQKIQDEMEKYLMYNPTHKKRTVAVMFGYNYIVEHKSSPIYVAIMFALMNSPILQGCYYDVYTNKDTGIKQEVLDIILPDRKIIIKSKANELF